MNINFSSTHLQTLEDIKKIAEKHNSYITFGFRSSSGREIDFDLLEIKGISKEVRKNLEIVDYVKTEDQTYDLGEIWFELHERDTGKHHYMKYLEMSTSFGVEAINYDMPEELEKFLDDYGNETGIDHYWVTVSSAPTYIFGFFNHSGEVVSDTRVYRPDMALKYFGDLVCGYFEEPCIEGRVY